MNGHDGCEWAQRVKMTEKLCERLTRTNQPATAAGTAALSEHV